MERNVWNTELFIRLIWGRFTVYLQKSKQEHDKPFRGYERVLSCTTRRVLGRRPMPQAPKPRESLQKLTETGNRALKVCGAQGGLVFARAKLLFKSRLSLIVRVKVVPNRTVVVDSDWRFDNPCGSHLQSQSELYHVSWSVLYSGYWSDWSITSRCYWSSVS